MGNIIKPEGGENNRKLMGVFGYEWRRGGEIGQLCFKKYSEVRVRQGKGQGEGRPKTQEGGTKPRPMVRKSTTRARRNGKCSQSVAEKKKVKMESKIT